MLMTGPVAGFVVDTVVVEAMVVVTEEPAILEEIQAEVTNV